MNPSYEVRLEAVYDSLRQLEFDTINALGEIGVVTEERLVKLLRERKRQAYFEGYIDGFYLLDLNMVYPTDEEVERAIETTGNGVPLDEMFNFITDGEYDTLEATDEEIKKIFVTETHKSSLAGEMDAAETAQSAGYEIFKRWDATLDDRTRDTHWLLHGTTIPLDDYFETYRGKAKAPGEFGIPEEDCNCRCILALRRGRNERE